MCHFFTLGNLTACSTKIKPYSAYTATDWYNQYRKSKFLETAKSAFTKFFGFAKNFEAKICESPVSESVISWEKQFFFQNVEGPPSIMNLTFAANLDRFELVFFKLTVIGMFWWITKSFTSLLRSFFS